jgi:hypothetical protein
MQDKDDTTQGLSRNNSITDNGLSSNLQYISLKVSEQQIPQS